MKWNGRAALLGLGLTVACASATEVDPLAPVPTRVDPDEIVTPALRVDWTYESLDEDGNIEVPTHTPAIGNGLIFVPYADRVEAIESAAPVWTVQLRDALAAAPLVLGDGVVLPTTTGWLQLDARGVTSGLLEWNTPVVDAFVVGDAIVSIGDSNISVIDLGPAGLSLRWQVQHPGGQRGLASPDGRSLFVTSDDGTLRAYGMSTGNRRWTSTHTEFAPLRPAIDSGTAVSLVFAIGTDGRMYAIRQRDGSRSWAGKDIGMRSSGSPIALDGLVWAPGLDAAAHAFTSGGGSHQFRIPVNGRAYLDLATWGSWVIVSPQYGPWVLIEGPRTSSGPADPGNPRITRVESDDDILLSPGVGAMGVVLVDGRGVVRFLTPERGLAPTR